ncbi:MFS transporter [Paenibacillus sp. P26]|nr:MFS transporter [Paenibacillus sp. P26]
MIFPNLFGRMLIVLPALFAEPWVFVTVVLVFHLLMGIQAPAYAALVTRFYPPQPRGRLMGNVRVAMGFLMIPLAYIIGRWIDGAGSSGPLITGAVTGVISILIFCGMKEIEPPPSASGTVRQSSLLSQFRLLKENRRLALFLAATTLSGFGNMLASPLYQIVQVQRLELSNVEIGYIRMVYYAMLILAYWLMGWVIDRYSPKHAMYFGIAGFTLVPLLYGAIGTYPFLLAAGGLQGFADATWDIGCLAYIFRIAPGREAVVFGLHLMLFGIRGTIGPPLSTALADIVPLPVLFFAAFACGILALLIFVSEKSSANASLSQSA